MAFIFTFMKKCLIPTFVMFISLEFYSGQMSDV